MDLGAGAGQAQNCSATAQSDDQFCQTFLPTKLRDTEKLEH